MKLHLPCALFRALLASAALATILATGSAEAGVVRHDYAMQQYKDFAMNQGQFRPGATNIEVFRTDGTSTGNVIPLMPSMASYAAYWKGKRFAGSNTARGNGGATLIAPHYIITAAHCGYSDSATDINFLCSSASMTDTYPSGQVYKGEAGYGSYGSDGLTQRLSKIVTDVAYTPLCTDDAFIRSMASRGAYLFRAGNGKTSMAQANAGIWGDVSIAPGSPLGGIAKLIAVYANYSTTGNYNLLFRLDQTESLPLTIGTASGDSGSPVYVYNPDNNQFETVGVLSTSTSGGYGNTSSPVYNPTATQNFIEFMTTKVDLGSSGSTVSWSGREDETTGAGTLRRGVESWQYIGANAAGDNKTATRDLLFTTTAANQRIELAANIDMGTASVGFDSGTFTLASSSEGDYSITNSAGFIINAGASVTTTLNGKGEEWRKVGEGILTIAGQGDNNINLNVGGGAMRFDEQGNIIHVGEVRLAREGGYAATNITLSAGVASIVLMRDNQINGNNFTFGNMGGVLNLNGHDLSWNSIKTNAAAQQQASEYGATIANLRPQGEAAPELATFTYTGNGTYKGAFSDGGSAEEGLLKVVYAAANATDTWLLTGSSDSAGGYEVNAGNMVLQGYLTPHTGSVGKLTTIAGDYTYAVMETGSVTVNNGASFTLADHALLKGDVVVENGTYVMKNTVNAAQEYVGGRNAKEDVTDFRSHLGNVTLNTAAATMRVETSAPVDLHYEGSINGIGNFDKAGSGKLVLNGANSFSGSKTITQGTVEFADQDALGNTAAAGWRIGEQGIMQGTGMNGSALLDHVHADSVGVLAMDADQATALNMDGHTQLILGAAAGKTIEYGAMGTTDSLTATAGAWRFGGGGGTLKVNFQLTGEGDLIIGNEFTSGTVYLTNSANDFSGDILIGGFNNKLTYDSIEALGDARVAVNYGNTLAAPEAEDGLLSIIREGATGVLALSAKSGVVSSDLDLAGDHAQLAGMALGAAEAAGPLRYEGRLSSAGDLHFGGSGTLELATELSGNGAMTIDAQGMQGGRIILSHANSFSGTVEVGGKLDASSAVPMGNISLVLNDKDALSSASSLALQQGATLTLQDSDATVRNLTAASGTAISNAGTEARTLTLVNDSNASFGAGTLAAGTARLNLVKEGSGTLTLAANNAYAGDITILGGKVVGSSSSSTNSSFGVQAAGNRIILGKDGTLDVSLNGCFGTNGFANARLFQTVSGEGTVVVKSLVRHEDISIIPGLPLEKRYSNQTFTLFAQTEAFEGTVRIEGNSRLLVGRNLNGLSNLDALNTATVVVSSGSQAVVTDRISGTAASSGMQSHTNFILNGAAFAGNNGSGYQPSILSVDAAGNDGALRVDCGTELHGNITLASNATVASWSSGSYGNNTANGGSLLGTISGSGKLTLAGNALLTVKADAANSHGSMEITNKAGVTLGRGAAQDSTSTALGAGTVTVGTTLTFDNAGTNDRDITYSYGNAITVNGGGTLSARHNTTELTGAVTIQNLKTINLATSDDAQLNLRGGLAGLGTANIKAGSHVGIGGSGSFTATVSAEAGAELTLLSENALKNATLRYTDNMTLSLPTDVNATDYVEYAVKSIQGSGTKSLTLRYDYTSGSSLSYLNVTEGLSGAFSSATIELDLNYTKDIETGTYYLIYGPNVNGMSFTLADDLNGRLQLLNFGESGLMLKVNQDQRLYWSAGNGDWDVGYTPWTYGENATSAYDNSFEVVFDASGDTGGGIANPTRVTLNEVVAPPSILVKDDVCYRIAGGGSIAGDATTLSIATGAELQLATSGNRFDGGVTLHEGTLVADAQNAVTSSSIEVGLGSVLRATAGEALVDNTISLTEGGRMEVSAANAVSGGSIRVGEGSILTASADHALSVNSITVQEGGRLTATAANAVSVGTLEVAAGGEVLASAANALSGETVSLGGLLEASATGALSSGTVNVNAGGELRAAATGAVAGTALTVASGALLHLAADNALGAGTTLTLASGATLRVSADNTLGSSTAASAVTAANFVVDEGATLTHYAAASTTIAKLSGEGHYVLNAAGATTITNMADFSGTVTKTGQNNVTITTKSATATWEFVGNSWDAALNLNNYTTGKVIFTGAYGTNGNSYLNYSGNAGVSITYAQDIEFNKGSGDFGLKITNGNSNQPIIFSGTVTGNGTFFLDRNSRATGVTDRFHFTGDLSAFEGGFHIKGTQAASGITLSDNGGATAYANNARAAGTGAIQMNIITLEANKYSLLLDYAADHGLANEINGSGNIAKQGAGNVTLSGNLDNHTGALNVQAGGLTLSGDKNLQSAVTVAAGASFTVSEGITTSSGSITAASATPEDGVEPTDSMRALIRVTESGTLAMGSRLVVRARNATAELENIVMSGSALTSPDAASIGGISNASILIGEQASRLRAVGAGEAAEAAAINFTNLDIVDTDIVNAGTDTVVFSNAYITSGSQVSNTGSGSVTLADCTLETGDVLVTVDNSGKGTLELDNLSNVLLADGLTLTLSETTSGNIAGALANGMSSMDIRLDGASLAEEGNFTLTLDSSNSGLDIRSMDISSAEGGFTTINLNFGAGAIPEPATATLALLGLAALAARRRRRN